MGKLNKKITSIDLIAKVNSKVTSGLKTKVSLIKIKNIKIFSGKVVRDVKNKTMVAILRFPERVDHVAIESLLNDGHNMHEGRWENI